MTNNSKSISRKRSIYADLSLLLVAIIWGGGFVAMKDALNYIQPFYIMTIRFGFSAILLAVIFYNKLKLIKKNDILGGIVVGILLYFSFSAQTIGLQYTTAGKQAFITSVYVIIVPFLSWFIKGKSPGFNSFLAGFLTLIGVGLLTLQSSFYLNLGDLLTLLCAILFAFHIISIEYFAKENDTIILSILQLGVAAFLSLFSAFIFEKPPVQFNASIYSALFYLVIFSTLLAFLIQTVAQRYTPSTHASLIMSLESLFGCIFSVILLKEIFTLNMIIGSILILFSVFLCEMKFSFIINLKKDYYNI